MSGKSFLREVLTDDHFAFVEALAAMDSRYGLNGLQSVSTLYDDILGEINTQKVIDNVRDARRAARWIRNGSLIASAILIADDVTVIGVADDVGLIVTLSAWGVSVIADSVLGEVLDILEQARTEEDLDVGHIDVLPQAGAGTFSIPDDCDPRQTGPQVFAGGREGSSRRLMNNLKETGCWCEDADVRGAAHHIVPKNSRFQEGQDLLQCLKDKGIDVDSAINGVCLPNQETDMSDALLHRGQEGALHGREVVQTLRDRCDNLNKEEFEDYLRQTAERYTNGLPPL